MPIYRVLKHEELGRVLVQRLDGTQWQVVALLHSDDLIAVDGRRVPVSQATNEEILAAVTGEAHAQEALS